MSRADPARSRAGARLRFDQAVLLLALATGAPGSLLATALLLRSGWEAKTVGTLAW